MDGSRLPQGKLPAELLARLLSQLPPSDAIIGASPGEDAAVLRAPQGYLLVTSDPITFSAAGIGRHAVLVNANDIAAMGGEPRWMLTTILLPTGSSSSLVAGMLRELTAACTELGIALVGGHTEVTDAVSRPVVSGTMLGSVVPDRLVTSGGAKPGDSILVSKPLAIEGTAILARDAGATLLERGLDAGLIERAAGLSERPGLSVLADSRLLCAGALPHAMHDVTEGGLATALRELCDASGVGLRVQRAEVPILPECQAICSALGLEPLGLLGSGSLIAAMAPSEAFAAMEALRSAGQEPAIIGSVTPGPQLLMVEPNGGEVELPFFARDELARYLEGTRTP